MINRIILFLSLLMLIFVGFLFYANMGYLFFEQPKEKHISYNAVRGIAVDYQGTFYTLNFNQQNRLLKFLNDFEPVIKPNFSKEELIGKIVIYRFNEPDLILQPMSVNSDEALYFKIPEWNREGVFQDTSNGKLKKLILDPRI